MSVRTKKEFYALTSEARHEFLTKHWTDELGAWNTEFVNNGGRLPEPVQKTEEWLEKATPAEISEAMEAGELQGLLTTPTTVKVPEAPQPREGQRDDKWLTQASTAQITEARAAGQLDDLLGVKRNEAGNTVDDLHGIAR
jgi:hypothetical protein